MARPSVAGERRHDRRDQVERRDQRAQQQHQHESDDQEGDRHDEPRVVGVRGLDVDVLGRDAADERARHRPAECGAEVADHRARLRRVRIVAQQHADEAGVRPLPRRRGRGQRHPGSAAGDGDDPVGLRPPGATTNAGELSPGGNFASRISVPSVASVARVKPWPKPIEPGCARLPSAATARDTPGCPRSAIRSVARTRPATRSQRVLLPGSARPGQNARGPSSAKTAGSNVKEATQHHGDADRQHRPERRGGLEVGEHQHEQCGDHRAAGGGDGRRAPAHRAPQCAEASPPPASSSR